MLFFIVYPINRINPFKNPTMAKKRRTRAQKERAQARRAAGKMPDPAPKRPQPVTPRRRIAIISLDYGSVHDELGDAIAMKRVREGKPGDHARGVMRLIARKMGGHVDEVERHMDMMPSQDSNTKERIKEYVDRARRWIEKIREIAESGRGFEGLYGTGIPTFGEPNFIMTKIMDAQVHNEGYHALQDFKRAINGERVDSIEWRPGSIEGTEDLIFSSDFVNKLRGIIRLPKVKDLKLRIELAKMLKDRGYDVKFIAYGPHYPFKEYPHSPIHRRRFNRIYKEVTRISKEPIIIAKSPLSEMSFSAIRFPRDLISQVGRHVFVRTPLDEEKRDGLGLKRVPLRVNTLAEGGAFLLGKDFALVSSTLAEDARRTLRGTGRKIYELPEGEHQITLGPLPKYLGRLMQYEKSGAPLERHRIFVRHDHVDLVANISQGNLVVDGHNYHHVPGVKEVVEEISKKHGLRLVVLPAEENKYLPANFLDLGDEVIVNGAAKRSIEKMKAAGMKVTAGPPFVNWFETAGYRCKVAQLHIVLQCITKVGMIFYF